MIAQGRLVGVRVLGRPPRGRRGRRALLLALALALVLGALLGGTWMWFRNSSLVAVRQITITGISGPDAPQIRSALLAAARNMTTLNVRIGLLRTAVAPYSVVKDLRVSAQLPHGLRIRVVEEIPVAAVSDGRRSVAVAADGTLLRDTIPSRSLPLIPLPLAPAGQRLTDPAAREAVALLAAAPYALLARVGQATTVPGHGLTAQLRSGPSVYFGDATGLRAKWIAAAAVLADPGSAGAQYIDVSDPERPVAGAVAAQTPSSGAGGGTTASSARTATPAAASTTTTSAIAGG